MDMKNTQAARKKPSPPIQEFNRNKKTGNGTVPERKNVLKERMFNERTI